MPRRYNAIKESIRERNPEMKLNEVKTHAAKIFEATRKPNEMHLSTVRAKERGKRVR